MRYNFKTIQEARNLCPPDVQDRDTFAIKVVAVAMEGDCWAAFYGPTDWPDEQVAMYGDKLTELQASPLFFALQNSGRHYRT